MFLAEVGGTFLTASHATADNTVSWEDNSYKHEFVIDLISAVEAGSATDIGNAANSRSSLIMPRLVGITTYMAMISANIAILAILPSSRCQHSYRCY